MKRTRIAKPILFGQNDWNYVTNDMYQAVKMQAYRNYLKQIRYNRWYSLNK